MPLLGQYRQEDSFWDYRGDAPPGGRGIGNPNDTIDRVRYRLRQPEGRYIPLGRGLYGGKALPQQTDRRDIVPVPMGAPVPGRNIKKPQSPVVPRMVGTTDKGSASARPPVVRRSPVPQKTPILPTKQTKRPEMGLDLGNLISTGLDLYKRYEEIRRPAGVAAPARVAAAPTPVAQTYWPEGYGVQQMAGPQLIDTAPGGGVLPGFDVIAEPPTDDTKGWVYKKVCGVWKWTKPKRRRRRKLLTDSDYNGLLKLQTLKVNSNMNIAIAKSIGR